jgi:hypothetical protein
VSDAYDFHWLSNFDWVFFIPVPFRMCLPLVKKREVELKSGKCIVPCSKWKHLLAVLFNLHLELGMKQLQASGCVQKALNDSRIYQLAQDLGTRLVLLLEFHGD